MPDRAHILRLAHRGERGPVPPDAAAAPRKFAGRAGRGLFVVGCLLLVLGSWCLSIHLENSRYLLEATAFIFDRPGDEENKAIQLVHFVAVHAGQPVNPYSASLGARLEHRLPLELSPVTVLKEGFAFPDARRFGPCGQLSRTVRSVTALRHIRSHKVLMGSGVNEHAMVAVHANGAYRLFDPTYDFHWTNRAGHVASIEEVRSDPEIFAQIYQRVPGYKYRLDDATYFHWSRLGRPGALVRSALVALKGRAWVENLDTPMLYERPWWGYTWVSLAGSIVFLGAGLALMLGRRRAREGAPRRPMLVPQPAGPHGSGGPALRSGKLPGRPGAKSLV